jgi:hypothetical protein
MTTTPKDVFRDTFSDVQHALCRITDSFKVFDLVLAEEKKDSPFFSRVVYLRDTQEMWLKEALVALDKTWAGAMEIMR